MIGKLFKVKMFKLNNLKYKHRKKKNTLDQKQARKSLLT